MKYRRFIIATAIVVSIFSLSPIAIAQQEQEQQRHTGRIIQSFTEPIEQSVVGSAETGIIAFAAVKEGDRVQVGQVLSTLNHNVLKRALAIASARAQATARLDAAKSQLNLTKSRLQALSELIDDGHANQFEVEQNKSEYENAVAELRSAQDELRLNKLEVKRIEAQIQDRIIKSPIDGFVTEIHKQVGENVSSNEPQYATIVRVDQLKVRFYQDAQTLGRLSNQQPINIRVGRRRMLKQAEITYVSPVIDPDSGLGRVDVVIDNQDFVIKSGVICYWDQPFENPTAQQFDDFQRR